MDPAVADLLLASRHETFRSGVQWSGAIALVEKTVVAEGFVAVDKNRR